MILIINFKSIFLPRSFAIFRFAFRALWLEGIIVYHLLSFINLQIKYYNEAGLFGNGEVTRSNNRTLVLTQISGYCRQPLAYLLLRREKMIQGFYLYTLFEFDVVRLKIKIGMGRKNN